MTKAEQKEVKKAVRAVIEDGVLLSDILFQTKQINGYVTLSHNDKYIIIENNKGGEAAVYLKMRTFRKIAKELGYSK